LALAALALVFFGAYDSYAMLVTSTQDFHLWDKNANLEKDSGTNKGVGLLLNL